MIIFIKRSSLSTALLALGLVFSAACSGPHMPLDRKGDVDGAAKLGGGLTFPAEIKKIFQARCLMCHDPKVMPTIPDWSKFSNVVANKDLIIKKVEAGEMPKGGSMPSDEKATLIKWLRDGAKGEASGDAPAASPAPQPSQPSQPGQPGGSTQPVDPNAPLTYKGQIRAIFEKHCLMCHKTGGMAAHVPWDENYELVKQKKDEIAKRVGEKLMPPAYQNPQTNMTDAERQAIINWVKAGVPFDGGAATQPSQPSQPGGPVNPGTPGTEITYTGQVRAIFEKHCLTCHKTGGMAAHVPWGENYELVKQKKDEIAKRVGEKLMPPPYQDPQTNMTDAEREIVKAWVAQGVPYEPSAPAQPPQPPQPPNPPPPQLPLYTYEGAVKTWFAHNCSVCHDGTSSAMKTSDGRKLSNFQKWSEVEPALGLIKQRVLEEKDPAVQMPPYGFTGNGVLFTDEQRVIIRAWLDAGAPRK